MYCNNIFFLFVGIDVELYECAYKYKGAGKSRQRVHTYTYEHLNRLYVFQPEWMMSNDHYVAISPSINIKDD